MYFKRAGRCLHRRNFLAGKAVADSADDPGWMLGPDQKVLKDITGGGFTVGTGDADEFELIRRVPVKNSRQVSCRQPRVRHQEDRDRQ